VKSEKWTVKSELWRVVAWGVAAVILWALWARPAAAHVTGTPHLSNAPAGDYLLTVWTAPDPPRANDFHVVVGVTGPDDPTLVLGATVMVTAVPLNGRAPAVSAPATHEQSDNRFLYEAYLFVEEPGLYEVSVEIVEADKGLTGAAVFTVTVEPAVWNWRRPLLWAGLLLFMSWLAWRSLPLHVSGAARRRRPVNHA
jgi:hypothetical protein